MSDVKRDSSSDKSPQNEKEIKPFEIPEIKSWKDYNMACTRLAITEWYKISPKLSKIQTAQLGLYLAKLENNTLNLSAAQMIWSAMGQLGIQSAVVCLESMRLDEVFHATYGIFELEVRVTGITLQDCKQFACEIAWKGFQNLFDAWNYYYNTKTSDPDEEYVDMIDKLSRMTFSYQVKESQLADALYYLKQCLYGTKPDYKNIEAFLATCEEIKQGFNPYGNGQYADMPKDRYREVVHTLREVMDFEIPQNYNRYSQVTQAVREAVRDLDDNLASMTEEEAFNLLFCNSSEKEVTVASSSEGERDLSGIEREISREFGRITKKARKAKRRLRFPIWITVSNGRLDLGDTINKLEDLWLKADYGACRLPVAQTGILLNMTSQGLYPPNAFSFKRKLMERYKLETWKSEIKWEVSERKMKKLGRLLHEYLALTARCDKMRTFVHGMCSVVSRANLQGFTEIMESLKSLGTNVSGSFSTLNTIFTTISDTFGKIRDTVCKALEFMQSMCSKYWWMVLLVSVLTGISICYFAFRGDLLMQTLTTLMIGGVAVAVIVGPETFLKNTWERAITLMRYQLEAQKKFGFEDLSEKTKSSMALLTDVVLDEEAIDAIDATSQGDEESSHFALGVAIVDGIAHLCKGGTSLPKLLSVSKNISLFNGLARSALTMKDMVTWTLTNLSSIIDFIWESSTGQPFFSASKQIAAINKTAQDLSEVFTCEFVDQKILDDSEFRNRIINNYDKLGKLRRSMASLGSSLTSTVDRLLSQHQLVYHRAVDANRSSRTRVEPVWLYMFGLPGRGKTTAIDLVLGCLYQALKKGKYNPNMRFERKQDSEFWDGYAGQWALTMDDVYQSTDVEDRKLTSLEFISAVNSNSFPLNYAYDKGLHTFTSEVVITTTNVMALPVNLGIEDPEAVYRRMHFCIEVDIKKEFFDKDGNIKWCDRSDVNAMMNMYVFRRRKAAGWKPWHKGQELSFKQLIELLIRFYYKQQKVYKDTGETIDFDWSDFISNLDIKEPEKIVEDKDDVEIVESKQEVAAPVGDASRADDNTKEDPLFPEDEEDEPLTRKTKDRSSAEDNSNWPINFGAIKSAITDAVGGITGDKPIKEAKSQGQTFGALKPKAISFYKSLVPFSTLLSSYEPFKNPDLCIKLCRCIDTLQDDLFDSYIRDHALIPQLLLHLQMSAGVRLTTCHTDGIVAQLMVYLNGKSVQEKKKILKTAYYSDHKSLYSTTSLPKEFSKIYVKNTVVTRQDRFGKEILTEKKWFEYLTLAELQEYFNPFKEDFDSAEMKEWTVHMDNYCSASERAILTGLWKTSSIVGIFQAAVFGSYMQWKRFCDDVSVFVEYNMKYNKWATVGAASGILIAALAAIFSILKLIFGWFVRDDAVWGVSQSADKSLVRQGFRRGRKPAIQIPGKQRGKFAPKQGRVKLQAIDENGMAIAQRVVSSNLFEARIVRRDATVAVTTVLFLAGRIAVCASHAMRNAATVELCYDDGDETHELFSERNFMVETDHERDLSFIFFKTARPRKNLESHLLSLTSERKEFALPVRAGWKDGVAIYHHAERAKKSKYNLRVNESTTVLTGLISIKGMPNENGDCGQPYFSFDTQFSEKLLGIHVAGREDESFCAPVYKEDIHRFDKVEEFATFSMAERPITLQTLLEITETREKSKEEKFNAPKGTCKYGELKSPVYMPNKTNFVPTSMQGKNNPYPILKKPVHLSVFKNKDGQYISPRDVALKRYTTVKTRNLPEEYKNPNVFKGLYYPGFDELTIRPLTMREAIEGVDGLIEGMSTNTSPGPGFVENGYKLSDLVHKTSQGSDYFVDTLLSDWVREYEKAALNFEFLPAFATDILKDELRPVSRVDAGKTRLFQNMNKAHMIYSKQNIGLIKEALCSRKNHKLQSDFATGINPESFDWKKIYLEMSKWEKTKYEDSDVPSYDINFLTQFIWLIVEEFWRICRIDKRKADLSREQWEWKCHIASVCLSSMYSVHFIGFVAYIHNGMASGEWATTLFNTIMSSAALRASWNKLCPPEMIDEFDAHVRAYHFGDDGTGGINSEKVPWFNQITIARALFELNGWEITNPDKSPITQPYKNIDEITFLMRRFRRDGSNVFCPLEVGSIYPMCQWVEKGEVPQREQEITNFIQAIHAFGHYGRERYESERYTLNRFIQNLDPTKVVHLSYDDWLDWHDYNTRQ